VLFRLRRTTGEAFRRKGVAVDRRISRARDDPRFSVLELRLHLKSELKVERYRLAQVPYVCPDSR
jgi:hypothetical protein